MASVHGPYRNHEVFNGFAGRASAAFFANDKVYLGMRDEDFSVYTQRVFNKEKVPVWLFSSQDETDLKFYHPKFRRIDSAFSVTYDTTKTMVFLIFNQSTNYYKLDFNACLYKVSYHFFDTLLTHHDMCVKLILKTHHTHHLFSSFSSITSFI